MPLLHYRVLTGAGDHHDRASLYNFLLPFLLPCLCFHLFLHLFPVSYILSCHLSVLVSLQHPLLLLHFHRLHPQDKVPSFYMSVFLLTLSSVQDMKPEYYIRVLLYLFLYHHALYTVLRVFFLLTKYQSDSIFFLYGILLYSGYILFL